MSALLEVPSSIDSRSEETQCIHIFSVGASVDEPALCGTTEQPHPECYDPLRWPLSYGWPAYVDLIDSCCPTCGRPLCAFCELLFRGA